MVTPVEKRSSNKFCKFHNDKGHNTNECVQLRNQIEKLPWQRVTRQKVTQSFTRVKEITFPPLTANKGIEGPLVIEAEIGGHAVHRIYIDRGSSMEVLYEHCFNRLWPEMKSQMVPTTTSLTGFSRETIWPLGQLRLLITIGDAEHYTKAWMNFMIVRSPSPYNGIIGRPGIREIQAVPSTAHGMLKFPVNGEIVIIRSTILTPTKCATIVATPKETAKKAEAHHEKLKVAIHPDFPDQEITIGGMVSTKARTELCTLLKGNLDIFAWQPPDMTGVPRSIAEHRLDIREGYSPEFCMKSTTMTGYPTRSWWSSSADTPLSVFWTPTKAIIKYKWRNKMRKIRLSTPVTGAAEGMFLGYKISPEGIKPCPDKTEAVLELPSPRTIKEDFKQLKQHLAKLPILVAPKPKEELIMYLSASYGAISDVLMTERDTVQTPVYFVSRALQDPKLNYTPMEKLPIKQVISRPDVAGRLQKWSIMLGEHNITYRPWTSVKGQILADFLIKKSNDAPPEASFTASNNEAEYEALIAGLRIAAQIGVRNVHLLVKVLKEKSIQEREVATVVEDQRPTWMTPIIEYLRDETLPDDQNEASKLRIKARQYELLEWILYRRSFLKPWLSCVGPLQADYIEAKAVATISGGQVKKFVWDNIVCRFGLPEEIVSDNGKQFSGDPFKDWCKMLNIVQRFALVKHSQSNRLVERANRNLGEGIKARLGKGNKNWLEELPHVLWAHRMMIKSSNDDTPFSLTYGTEAVIPAEIEMPTYRTAVVNVMHNDEELRLNLDLLEERHERAAICEAKAKLNMTKYYNARVRGVTFRPRDFPYRSNDASHAVDGGKLGPKWEGPYKVMEALGDGAYKLRSIDGAVLPRTWNIVNLKKCHLSATAHAWMNSHYN
ncbi:reverse transcriptase domain-containing protein [Tanacetum coccineum]